VSNDTVDYVFLDFRAVITIFFNYWVPSEAMRLFNFPYLEAFEKFDVIERQMFFISSSSTDKFG
jgi:hypothetical protein